MDCRTDLIFALDSSGSVGRANWERMKAFVRSFLSDFQVREDGSTRVGVMTYSNRVEESFNLIAYNSTVSLQAAISSLAFSGGSTNTAAALWHARRKMLTSEAGDRSSVPNVVVVLTDGLSNCPASTVVSIQQGWKKRRFFRKSFFRFLGF